MELGNVDEALKTADYVFEGEYEVPRVSRPRSSRLSASTWMRTTTVFRTSTQVPFHARRILAVVLGLPIKRIRVLIKPRCRRWFGNKQEVIEDICGHLTIATKRPVKLDKHAARSSSCPALRAIR